MFVVLQLAVVHVPAALHVSLSNVQPAPLDEDWKVQTVPTGAQGSPVRRTQTETIGRRALSSAAVVGARGVAVRAVQFVGTLVLARLLTPAQFGILAFGSTVLTMSLFVADLGLGAGKNCGARGARGGACSSWR